MAIKARHKLIPALAMLIVAAVTLTSASYAWFTMSRTVTATGINLTAVAPTNLLISNNETTGFAETTIVAETFGTGKLIPSSSADGIDFYAAENILNANGGAPVEATKFSKVTTALANDTDGYYADFKLWLATSGENAVDVKVSQLLSFFNESATSYSAVSGITETNFEAMRTNGTITHYTTDATMEYTSVTGAVYATINAENNLKFYKKTSISDSARFAILNGTGAALTGNTTGGTAVGTDRIYGLAGATTPASNVNYFASLTGPINTVGDGGTGNNVYKGTAITANADAILFTVAGMTSAQITAGNTNGTPTAITVRVWIEGQDKDCISSNANANFDLQVGFKDALYTE